MALHSWNVIQACREGGVVCKRGGELKHWMQCGGSSVHVHESFAFYTLSALGRNSSMVGTCPRVWLMGGGGGGGAGAGGTRGGDDWSGVFGMG